jgi:hypothetical protein
VNIKNWLFLHIFILAHQEALWRTLPNRQEQVVLQQAQILNLLITYADKIKCSYLA